MTKARSQGGAMNVSDDLGSVLAPPKLNENSLAFNDFLQGLLLWKMAWRTALKEVARRYRRTVLGPFWTTLSFMIFALIMGVVYSSLWKMDIEKYLPYITSGMVSWAFISSVVTEGSQSFVAAEGIIKNSNFPYTFFALTSMFRGLIVFLHHIVIYIIICLIFKVNPGIAIFLVPVGILYVMISGLFLTMLVSLLCSRYRDIYQVIISMLQIIMFVTPIFWDASMLTGWKHRLFVDGNLIYHIVSILREPMLGKVPALSSYIISTIFMAVISVTTIFVFARFRRKLVYWL